MSNDKFPMTTGGYLAAKKWLKEKPGRWEYHSTHGFSVDGWSITATANFLYKKEEEEGK